MSRKSREAEIEQRRKKVAANLLGGLNYREMAEVFGVAIGTISGDVAIILGRWRRDQVATVDEWIQIEARRLDKALNAIWDSVLAGDAQAIDRMIKIMERRSKLLGLDAPARKELSGPDGGPIKVENVGLSDSERAARIVAILDQARARGAGLPAEPAESAE